MRLLVLSLPRETDESRGMTQFAFLTESLVRDTLNERKGELVVERAPASEGPGWIITLDVQGARCVVVTERTLRLRVFKEANSAVAFVERNSIQKAVRIVFDEAADVPSFGLPPIPPAKKPKTTKSVQKPKPKRT